MKKKVRLSDIAEELGLTKVSVSKALRGHPDISEETRALVERTAAEMGYMPNLLARSLSSNRSLTLGVVVPKIAHTFFASIIDAIQEKATAEGYGIVLAISQERSDLERQHIERLLSMRVDGLLISTTQEEPDLDVYERVRAMHVPLVFFDRKIDHLPFSSVTIDDFDGAYRAVMHLVQQGHRRIAHVAGTQDVLIGRARREGYEAALRDAGIDLRVDWILEGGFDEMHGYRAFRKLHETGELPQAILAASFPVEIGIRGAMRQLEVDLIEQIEIVSFGRGGFTEFHLHPHVSVLQPTKQMGEQAVEILLQEIAARDPMPARHVVLEAELVTRQEFWGRISID